MKNANKILVLGLGNYLMSDEGVGVHFIERMQKENLPDYVDLLDGGTAGFLLMDYLESYAVVVMVDATLDHHPPGTIRLIEPKFARDFPKAMSTHEIGLKDLVESLSLLNRLPQIYLYVMSVADIAHLHIGLSESIEKAMPDLIAIVKEKIEELSAHVSYEIM